MYVLIAMTGLMVGQCDAYDCVVPSAEVAQHHGVLRGECGRPVRRVIHAVLERKPLRRAVWRVRDRIQRRPLVRRVRLCLFRRCH